MLTIFGGQLWNHRVGLKVGYKTNNTILQWWEPHEGHEEPNYDLFCYVHVSYVSSIEILS